MGDLFIRILLRAQESGQAALPCSGNMPVTEMNLAARSVQTNTTEPVPIHMSLDHLQYRLRNLLGSLAGKTITDF